MTTGAPKDAIPALTPISPATWREGNKPYCVRLNPSQQEHAERLAAEHGLSVPEVLRLGLHALDQMQSAHELREYARG